MQTDILNLERTIARSRKDVIRWLEYKDIGSKERAKQIELLEKELKDMKQSYDEMSGKNNLLILFSKGRKFF